ALTIMRQAKENILQIADPTLNAAALKHYLDVMPPRYFLANTPAAVLEHFRAVQSLPKDGFLFRSQVDRQEKMNRFLIYTVNNPRLFEQVTGVMAANQVNILAFEQFFNSKGEALLLLKATDHRGELIEEERRTQTLERDLRGVLHGHVSL